LSAEINHHFVACAFQGLCIRCPDLLAEQGCRLVSLIVDRSNSTFGPRLAEQQVEEVVMESTALYWKHQM